MPLIPLQIPKGQYRNGTEYMSQGRWRDGNLVRWHDDALRPVGGWVKRQQADTSDTDITSVGSVAGAVRGTHTWLANDSSRYAAFGTYNGLVIMLESSALSDITPAGLVSGRIDATINTGWGSGGFGYYSWGSARPDLGSILPATTWSLDNWGEDLIACSSDDGTIYQWVEQTSTIAAVANAPSDCTAAFVTEERFLVALGCDDGLGDNRRRVAWSDQEDLTDWTASATNQAGDINLQTSGTILAGVRTRGQSLILTTEDAHTMTYQGPPFVYGFERVGTSCGMIAAGAYASVDAGVIWMGKRGFFIYSGGAVRDLPCEVADYVFSDINFDQQSKVQAVQNSQWNEIWWFYQSNDSDECDSYVAYDYVENVWMTGKLDRTSGFDRGVFRNPMFVDVNGIVYEHETGNDYGNVAPFCETGPIALGAGDRIMKVTKMIRDEKTQGDVRFDFKTRMYPNSEETSHGPYPSDFIYESDFSVSPPRMGQSYPADGNPLAEEDKNKYDAPTSVRFQGRQVRMKVSGTGSDWRVGVVRLEARQGSKR